MGRLSSSQACRMEDAVQTSAVWSQHEKHQQLRCTKCNLSCEMAFTRKETGSEFSPLTVLPGPPVGISNNCTVYSCCFIYCVCSVSVFLLMFASHAGQHVSQITGWTNQHESMSGHVLLALTLYCFQHRKEILS